MHFYEILCFMVFAHYLFGGYNCEEQVNSNCFLAAAKHVPRIGRATQKVVVEGPDMGKFFWKASKSVPRIGRRNQGPEGPQELAVPYVYRYDELPDQAIDKRGYYPMWSQLADRFEYDPELFSSHQALLDLEQEMGDDPTAYDWGRSRAKRSNRGGPQQQHPKNVKLQRKITA